MGSRSSKAQLIPATRSEITRLWLGARAGVGGNPKTLSPCVQPIDNDVHDRPTGALLAFVRPFGLVGRTEKLAPIIHPKQTRSNGSNCERQHFSGISAERRRWVLIKMPPAKKRRNALSTTEKKRKNEEKTSCRILTILSLQNVPW